MSIRTLVEFNHDYIRELEENPDQVVKDLLQILLHNTMNPLCKPDSQLMKLKWSRHHSDDCPTDIVANR